MENYFDSNYDTNAKSIIYADLSHINSSLVTSTNQMFKDCNSIKEINLENFETSLIEYMTEMFSGCSQLHSLDLSYFNTSSVKNMNNMLSGCSSLEYLDISSFDSNNLKDFTNMFSGADIIKYINLFNIQNYDNLVKAISISSNLNNKDNLTVCQKNNIINNEKALYDCCVYWDYNLKKVKRG